MKKLILSIIIAGFAFANAQAAAYKEKHWYVQGTGSFGWHNKTKPSLSYASIKEHRDDFGASLSVGHIMDLWRLELEGSCRHHNASLMANLFYDFPLICDLSIYIGAGAGISSIYGKVNIKEEYHKKVAAIKRKGNLDNVFAWQLMTGVTFALSENWDLVAGYRLFSTAKPTIAKLPLSKKKFKTSNIPFSHNVELGLRFKF